MRSVERLLADARRLPPARYLEIRYEAFTESPETVLSSICAFAGLPSSARLAESVERRTVTSRNVKYKSQFGEDGAPDGRADRCAACRPTLELPSSWRIRSGTVMPATRKVLGSSRGTDGQPAGAKRSEADCTILPGRAGDLDEAALLVDLGFGPSSPPVGDVAGQRFPSRSSSVSRPSTAR